MARASELFAERWTPIIIRNLLSGCETFGDLLAGAPGISRALLAQRLGMLETHAIVIVVKGPGRGRRYTLTEMGRELKALTDAMGTWGARWLELEAPDLDPAYVLWATCRLVDLGRIPAAGLVVRVELADDGGHPYWMMVKRPVPEICSVYPGSAEDLVWHTDSETLARWHLRHISYADAVKDGRMRLDGPPGVAAMFIASIRSSPFAVSTTELAP